MADARVLARIDAWASAGLIDEATADRLRSAEAAAGDEADRSRPQRRGVSPSALFGPGISVGEMFAYLGAGFLLAAWFALIARLASDSLGRDPIWAFGAIAAAIMLGALGLRIRRASERLRRAAGVAFVASAALLGGGAYVLAEQVANRSRSFDVASDASGALLAGATVWLAFALAYRRLHPSLLTQAGLILAVTTLASAILGVIEPIVFGARSFEGFDPDPDNPLRVVLAAAGWLITAVVLGLIGLGEARSRTDGSPTRAALTRFAAGLTAVLGTASAVFATGNLGNDEYGRLVEPVVGAGVLIVLSAVLLERAFRRDSSAFVYPAALGVIIGLSDLNATYFATAAGAELALLLEGAILLGAGFAFDRVRRQVGTQRDHVARRQASDPGGRDVGAAAEPVEVGSPASPS